VVDDLLRYGDSSSSNRVPAEAGRLPEPTPAGGPAGLTLRGVAAALGLSVGVVRGHVRADRLAASQIQGKRGSEYRVCPAVVTAFAAERPQLEPAARGNGSQELAGASEPSEPSTPSTPDDVRELQERLQEVTDEVARCKALGAAAAEHYRDELTRLQNERDAALVQANAVTAELEHLGRRGLLSRLLGG
jgi:hypothetical protein